MTGVFSAANFYSAAFYTDGIYTRPYLNGSATTFAGASLGSPQTFSHTVASGTNQALIVFIGYEDAADDPTGVTYAGVAMTKAASAIEPVTGLRSQLWYLAAPKVGANNVVITMTGQLSDMTVIAQTVGNVDQTTTLGAIATNVEATGATVFSVNLTTTKANSMVIGGVDYGRGIAAPAFTPATGAIEIVEVNDGVGTTLITSAMNYQTAASISTVNNGATAAANDKWTGIAIELLAPQPPVIVIADTHDGITQTHVEIKYKRPVDPFDRAGLLEQIQRAAGIIVEQEPEKAGEIEALETEIRQEIQLPTADPLELALAIDRMATLAIGIDDLYANLYALSQKLYDEQEEEEIILSFLM